MEGPMSKDAWYSLLGFIYIYGSLVWSDVYEWWVGES